MLGNERGFKPGYRVSDAREMFAIDAIGGAKTQAYAVQTQRIIGPRPLERTYRGAALVEIVFSVRFDPADGRTFADERVVVNGPKADSGTCRNRPRPHTS
jgi:hypothetical protein